MPNVQNFSLPLGDRRAQPFAAVNDDATDSSPATPYDLTGKTLVLFVSRGLPDGGTYAFQKSSASGGITIINPPTAGLANINFLEGDTAGLPAGQYPFALRDETLQVTLTSGLLTLSDHAGR